MRKSVGIIKSLIILIALLIPLMANAQQPEIASFYAYPNPFTNTDSLTVLVNVASADAAATATLEVYDQLGDRVATIADAQQMITNTNITFSWNGLDKAGNHPQPGGYFLKLKLVFPSGDELNKIYKVVHLEKLM
jgi:hypothetical protein